MNRQPTVELADIDKEYAGKPLLRDARLGIFDGERCALVGRNGCGKSTLIRLILGQERPDSGEVIYRKGIRAASLAQHPDFSLALSPAEAMSRGTLRALGPEGEPRDFEMEISDDTWRKMADSLAFPMDALGRTCEELSGGERTKVALVRALSLAQSCDLLIMDEPTSHLDIPSMEWLERRLPSLGCSQLIVSHDRYFMDAVAQRVVSFEDSGLQCYTGNYTAFYEKREGLRRAQRAAYERQQAEMTRMRSSIEEMRRRWRFDAGRFKSKEKALERIEAVEEVREEDAGAPLKFRHKGKTGRELLAFEDVSFSWGGRAVIRDASFTIETGDRIGFIGTNGSGKSTVAKLLMQRLEPNSGRVRIIGKTVPGYFAQEHEGLDMDSTPVQEIRNARPEMSEETVKGLLSAFMLGERERASKVGMLSGGERARLALLKLVLSETNLLVLDEPTNYLDTMSRHAVEEALVAYEGAVLLITHDRYLLDRIATRIFALREGAVESFPGNYTQFRERKPFSVRGDRRRKYRIAKKFKDWATGETYSPGAILMLAPEEEERFRWAIDNKALVLEED